MLLKQRDILNELAPDFARNGQSQEEYIAWKEEQIIRFIREYTESARADGWVIGISGGIDSFLAGALLAKAACGDRKKLLCVLLPNGEQKDLRDAQECAERISELYPDADVTTVNIGHGFAGALEDLDACPFFKRTPYSVGNLQPRLRMLYQYALAAGLLVCGTDHASEAITGFYTKYGDGGVDFNPLGQMVKDDIYAMSASLGAPRCVMDKAPAAGIGISEDDESELGISYEHICAFLKGNRIPDRVEEKLIRHFDTSAHKRAVPPTTAWLDQPRPVPRRTHVRCGAGSERALAYINENPDVQVLYVGVSDPEPYRRHVRKTVNTPLEQYNMFRLDGSALGDGWGSLRQNLQETVLMSGPAEVRAQVEAVLETVPFEVLGGLDEES